MIAKSADRVRLNTPESANEKIRLRTELDAAEYAGAPARAIRERVNELDAEWDIERVLELNAGTVISAGLVLALLANRKWMALSLVASGFLVQHALQGWCPPVSLFRRLGIRTRKEIDEDKFALKALRGDFEGLAVDPSRPSAGELQRVLNAVRH